MGGSWGGVKFRGEEGEEERGGGRNVKGRELSFVWRLE